MRRVSLRWRRAVSAVALLAASAIALQPAHAVTHPTAATPRTALLASSAARTRAAPIAVPTSRAKAGFRTHLAETSFATTTTTVTPPTTVVAAAVSGTPEEQAGRAALARVTYPWAATGYTIVFSGARPGLFGLTKADERRIEIYVRPGENPDLLAHVIAHEIGHAVDKTFNNAARRAQWLAIRGLAPSTGWFTCNRCHDFDTPAGDYAETFALWQLGLHDFRGTVAPEPDAAMLARLVPLFAPS
jgi:hypothetical protein